MVSGLQTRLILVLTGVHLPQIIPDIFPLSNLASLQLVNDSRINQSFMNTLITSKMVDCTFNAESLSSSIDQHLQSKLLLTGEDGIFVHTIESSPGQRGPELPTVTSIPTASRERLLSTHCRSNCLQPFLCLHKQGILSQRRLQRAQLKLRLQLT